MHITSIFWLLSAAGTVAILHSILPDHWVPLAVIARTQRWSLWHVGRVALLASLGHVITTLLLGGLIALIGLQFQHQIETQQGHIVGVVLVLTGIGFLIWGLVGHGPHGRHHEADHPHEHELTDKHIYEHELLDKHDDLHKHKHTLSKEQPLIKRLAAIAVPFGMAASPDLTVLPVALAASAIGTIAVVSVLSVFTIFTIATFIALTIIATMAGYQIKGDWLEEHANTITSLVLIGIGIVAYLGV
jgi:nickel/cobalt transporter (NicO) family protein